MGRCCRRRSWQSCLFFFGIHTCFLYFYSCWPTRLRHRYWPSRQRCYPCRHSVSNSSMPTHSLRRTKRYVVCFPNNLTLSSSFHTHQPPRSSPSHTLLLTSLVVIFQIMSRHPNVTHFAFDVFHDTGCRLDWQRLDWQRLVLENRSRWCW